MAAYACVSLVADRILGLQLCRHWALVRHRGEGKPRRRLHRTPVRAVSTASAPPPAQARSRGPPPISRARHAIREEVVPSGQDDWSPNHKKLEDYILGHLKGDEVGDDSFRPTHPEGSFQYAYRRQISRDEGCIT